jgi:hypothetical protein
MNIYAWSSIIAFLIVLTLGIHIWSKNPKQKLNQLLLLMTFFASILLLSDYLLKITTSPERALVYAVIRAVSWGPSIALLLHFMLVLAEKESFLKKKITYIILYGIPLIFAYLIARTSLVILGIKAGPFGYQPISGPWNWIARLIFLFYIICAIYY